MERMMHTICLDDSQHKLHPKLLVMTMTITVNAFKTVRLLFLNVLKDKSRVHSKNE